MDNENKFKKYQVVKHLKSGNEYVIKKVPDEDDRLEYCNESYYQYVSPIDGIKWNRRKSEMEDGRFELVK